MTRCAQGAVWVSGGATLELEDCVGQAEGGFGLMAMGPGTIIARRSRLAQIMLTMGPQLLLNESSVTGQMQLGGSSITASGCEFTGGLELGRASIAFVGCRLLGPVSLRSQAGAVLERCTFEVDRIGLSLVADAEAEVRGCRFTGGQIACDISDQATLKLIDCEITGCERAGIRVWDRARLKLVRGQVSQAGEYGVLAKGEVSVEAEDCTFSGCGDGMRLLSGARASLEGCSFLSNRAYGLAALSGAAVIGSGNTFRGNGCDLIGEVAPGVRRPLREARLEEVHYPAPGLESFQEAVDALLPGGTLFISGGVQTAGCVIEKPVAIVGQGPELSALSAPSPDLPAISVVPGGELSLEGVELRGGAFGVMASGTGSADLAGVRASGGKIGIALWQAAELSLTGCEITANEVGLELRGDSRARVLSCRFTENAEAGIYLWDQAHLHLEGSSLTGNGKGLICYVQGCGFAWAPAEFAGAISGAGNVISGNSEADLCPPYPGAPWPSDFVLEAP